MNSVTIWKVTHKAGDEKDWLTFSLKRNGYFPLVLSNEHFTMLFPNIEPASIPEAPNTVLLHMEGGLLQ